MRGVDDGIVMKNRTTAEPAANPFRSSDFSPPPAIGEIGVSVLLKSRILYLVLSGGLRSGMRLPTVREISGCWNLNRNAVSAVYRDLEEEGYLETRRGKGTVVSSGGRAGMAENLPDLLALLGGIVREGLSLGLTREEIVGLAIGRTGEAGDEKECRFAVVECNREDLEIYRYELEKELGVPVKPILLSELRTPGAGRVAAGVSVVMTTFTHLKEVRTVLSGTKTMVAGLLAGSRLEDIVDFGTFPRGSRIAVVCMTSEKARMLKRKLQEGYSRTREVTVLSIEETPDLIRALRPYEAIIVSGYTARKLPRNHPPFQKRITYSNLQDPEGVEMLRKIV